MNEDMRRLMAAELDRIGGRLEQLAADLQAMQRKLEALDAEDDTESLLSLLEGDPWKAGN